MTDWITGATSRSDFQLYDKNASYPLEESTQISERSDDGMKRRQGFAGAKSSNAECAVPGGFSGSIRRAVSGAGIEKRL